MACETMHITLSPLDHLPPRNYAKLGFYLPLQPGIEAAEVFADLHEGLRRTFLQVPWLGGKIHWQSRDTPGWRPGQLEIRHPVDPSETLPYQLRFEKLPSDLDYADLEENGFPTDAFADEDVLWAPFLADIDNGAEVFVAQANFLPGAVLLAMSMCHSAGDAPAMVHVMRLWAEQCRLLQGEDGLNADVPTPLAPEYSDRTIFEKAWVAEGTRTADGFDQSLYGIVRLNPPTESSAASGNGHATEGHTPAPALVSPPKMMKSCIFYMSAASFATLKKECVASTSGASDLSGNDVVTALLWRALLRARLAAHDDPKALVTSTSELEMTVDGRSGFSDSVPTDYLGNVVFANQVRLSVAELTDTTTSLGRVATVIRGGARTVNHDAMHAGYGLLRAAPDFNNMRLSLFPVDGADLCVSSLLMFNTDEIAFGSRWFKAGGRPAAMRVLMGAFSSFTRIAFVLPRKSHGGVELSLSLFDHELDCLLEDAEFGRFAVQLS